MFNLLRSILNILIFFFAMCTLGFAQTNEQITLTTYYPSPQGSYVELRSKRLALGEGYLSPVSYCWAPLACANVINANTDLVVEGNAGIGTFNPFYKLEVGNISDTNNYIRIQSSNVGTGGLLLYDGQGTQSGTVAYDHSSDAMIFETRNPATGPSEKMRITSSGSVGIGTSAPEPFTPLSIHSINPLHLRLQTDAGTNQGPHIDFVHAGEVGGRGYEVGSSGTGNRAGRPGVFEIYDQTAGEDWLVIDGPNSGNVGIGTTTPGYTLTVAGTAWCASGAWEVVSDARLKKDIRPLENSLETILKLQGVSFKWINPEKGQTDQLQRGFIAQDVEKVIPEWVKTDSNGYKSLEKVGVEALLVEAIKEQQQEIKNLKAEVEALKAKINPGK